MESVKTGQIKLLTYSIYQSDYYNLSRLFGKKLSLNLIRIVSKKSQYFTPDVHLKFFFFLKVDKYDFLSKIGFSYRT